MNRRQKKKKWKKIIANTLVDVKPIKEKRAEVNILRVYHKGGE